jgi:hypothetical protein
VPGRKDKNYQGLAPNGGAGMKGKRILGIGLFALACVFFLTSVVGAREVTVVIKGDSKKLQLSAVRTDGSVVAEVKRTRDTGKVTKKGVEIRKQSFTLDIPAGEKVMLVISKVKGNYKTAPDMIRLKPKKVIAFWADEARSATVTQFVVTDCSGNDPIDLGVVKTFKGKLAMARHPKDPDDSYNALKQVDTDCDGENDFWDTDDDNDGINDDVDTDDDGNGIDDDLEDMDSENDGWPDIVDPDDDNDFTNDNDDCDDDDDGIPDWDGDTDSDDDGIDDDQDEDDDNDGIEDDQDEDQDGDGILDSDEQDTDSDGIPDDFDEDDDNDGIEDDQDEDNDGDGILDEDEQDQDGDCEPDDSDEDDDNDGIPDHLDEDNQ